MMAVDQYIDPLKTRGVEVSGPHTAQSELDLIRETEALYWRGCPGVAQWVCMEPYLNETVGVGSATPRATLLAVDTWYDFNWHSVVSANIIPFGLPHRPAEGFDRIMGDISIVTATSARLRVRLVTTILLDSLTPTTGDASHPVYPTEPSRMTNWSFGHGHVGATMYRGQKVCYVDAPAAAAGTVVIVKPQVKIDEENFDIIGSANAKAYVYLQHLALIDIPPVEVGM